MTSANNEQTTGRTLVDQLRRMDELDRFILYELRETAKAEDGFKRFFVLVDERPDNEAFAKGIEDLTRDPEFFRSASGFSRKHAATFIEYRALSADIGRTTERGDVTREQVLNAIVVKEFAIAYRATLEHFSVHYKDLVVQK